jgi:hypothetical protein
MTDAIKLSDVLGTHQLAQAIFEGARKVIRDTATPGSALKINPSPTRDLTEAEFFAQACGYSLTHLLGLVSQIECIPAYLRSYKRSTELRAAGVSRVSDLAYHWENYLIRARALEDRVLHLFTSVLHIGVSPRHVNFGLVRQSVPVKSLELGETLDRVHALVEPMAGERNRLVHERGVLDAELRELEFWLLAQRSLPEHKDVSVGTYLTRLRSIVPAKAAEVEAFLTESRAVLTAVFDALVPMYRRTASKLGANSK